MTKTRELGLEDTVAMPMSDVHGALTVVRAVEDVFGGVTRAVPQLGASSVDVDTSQMTSVWVSPLRESHVTEAVDARLVAATVAQMPRMSRRTLWRVWTLAGLVVALLLSLGMWRWRGAGHHRVNRIARTSANVVTVNAVAKPVVQAPLSVDERARQEAAAAAALIAGDRALALRRYRALAVRTGESVFARAARVLETMP